MKPKTYILQKDLPDSKAGNEYIYVDKNVPFPAFFLNGLIFQSYWMPSVVENNPEWFKLKVEKPPLGLIPLYLHNYNRLNDIKVAIVRYKEVGKDVPQEWLFEENDLETKLGLDYNENQARINQKSHTKNS